jgi:hypothetical protein
MKGTTIEERATELAHYIIDSKDTVRGAAAKYGVSKSTVHTGVTIRNGEYPIGRKGKDINNNIININNHIKREYVEKDFEKYYAN